MEKTQKQKIGKVTEGLNKTFGKGTVYIFGDAKEEALVVDVFSTGSISVDEILGNYDRRGIPRGRITEIWGPPGGGKTSLCMQTIAEAQRAGETAAFIDVEYSFDPAYARALGVKVEDLIFSQPDYGEEALQIAETLIKDGGVGIIVVDSVANLVPKTEYDGEIGDSVSGDTPVFTKRNGLLDIVPIEDLYGGTTKFSGKNSVNVYKKNRGRSHDPLLVLTGGGWRRLRKVWYKRNLQGKPIVLTKGNFSCAQTTPDHCLFSGGKEIKPSELSVGSFLDVRPPEKINNKVPVTRDMAWLLGYFCADGSMDSVDRAVTFSSTERRLIKYAGVLAERTLCVSVRIKPKIYSEGSSRKPLYSLSCSVKPEIHALFSLCYTKKSRYKKIPDIILNSSEEIKRAFLDGFTEGDGSITDYGKVRFSTSSYPLAAGLQYMVYCLGLEGYLAVSYRRGNFPEFTIGTNDSTSKRYKDNEIRKFYMRPAPEFLYDLTTEDGTFVGGIGFVIHHNSGVGQLARMMTQATRKLSNALLHSDTALIFINQIRDVIGSQFPMVKPPGGNGLEHLASLRLEVKRIGSLKDGDKIIGARTKVKTLKNKSAAPYQECEVDIIFGKGVSHEAEVIEYGVKLGFVEKDGNSYSYNGERMGVGKENTRLALMARPDIFEAVRTKVREKLFLKKETK